MIQSQQKELQPRKGAGLHTNACEFLDTVKNILCLAFLEDRQGDHEEISTADIQWMTPRLKRDRSSLDGMDDRIGHL